MVLIADEVPPMSEKHCSRCGAVLPEVDEGLCPVCETPFGARTVAMEVSADQLAQFAAAREAGMQKKKAGERPQADTAPVPPATMPMQTGSDGPPKALIIGIALVVAALVAVLGLLLVSRGG